MLTPDDVARAHERIRSHIRSTPIVIVEADAFATPQAIVLKLELLQHTGSFKARGATNAILRAQAEGRLPEVGIVAASGGNHGLAVAFAARRAGARAQVFVPETASALKVAGIRALGATVTVTGHLFAEAYAASQHAAEESGALFVHPYDDLDVVAGQGTAALELAHQAAGAGAEIDTVLVAVGGGGLAGGTVAAIGDVTRVVGVEPTTIPTWHAARSAGRPVGVEVSGIAADSLGAQQLGDIGYALLSEHDAGSVLVGDDAIASARRRLWRVLRLVAEPGGATALAALWSGAYRPEPGERVGVVICGSNTDPSNLSLSEHEL